MLCIFVLSLYIKQSNAQQKIDIEIIPIDTTEKSIISYKEFNLEATDSLTVRKKLKQFSDYWFNKGYLSCSFDSTYFDSLQVRAFFYLGYKYVWDSLNIENIPPIIIRKSGFGNSRFKKNSINLNQFLKLKQEILEYYENNGYPFAETKIDSLNIDSEVIQGKLIVKVNSFVRIDSILIKGAPKISRKFLFYYLDIKRGDAYNQGKINGIEKAVEELPFLQMAKPTEIEFREGKADLYLYLKSRPANYFNGIIGFASGTEESPDFQITGDLNLILLNAFKIGEQLELYWDKYSTNSQNLRLGFQFPYLFFLPIGIDFQFGLEKYNVDYFNTSLFGGLEYSFSAKNKVKAFVSQKKSYLIDSELDTANAFGQSSRFVAGLTFYLENTDYRFNPRKGLFFEASSGYGTRNTLLNTTSKLLEINVNTAFYLKIGAMGTIAFLNKSAASFSNELFFENELYKIGGINTLRGFDEKAIFASSYSIFSFEPRLLFGKNSAIYLFGDWAWYESKQIDNQITDTPFGFGLGLNIDTKAGIFKLNYALGKQFDNPIKFSGSKVHFGFSARF